MQGKLIWLLGSLLVSNSVNAMVWFTDMPADKRILKEMSRSHGGYVWNENERYSKQLWLKSGETQLIGHYEKFSVDQVRVFDINQQPVNANLVQNEKSDSIRFEMPEEGFYNAFYTLKSVREDGLNIEIAKFESLKHSCKLGHNYDRKWVQPNVWIESELDVIRLRLPHEDFHTRLRSGNNLKFKVLHLNQPVAGALVNLETQKGWSHSLITNQEGVVDFQIIQDNFPVDEDDQKSEKPSADDKKTSVAVEKDKESEPQKTSVSKRGGHGDHQQDNYLLTVHFSQPDAGVFQGVPYKQIKYTMTMGGRYEPNIQVSQSKSLALIYASAGFLTLGIGATVYRRRRIKPFKEAVFDEH